MAQYKNPASWSSQRLYDEIMMIKDDARKRMRQYQRKATASGSGGLYSSRYESLTARNRQDFGQNILPARIPETREGMELYFRRAQAAINLPTVPEARKEIFAEKAALEKQMGITIEGKFGYTEQKLLSDFLHSDEWKRLYSFGSATAIDKLAVELVNHPLADDKSAAELRKAFDNFKLTATSIKKLMKDKKRIIEKRNQKSKKKSKKK